MFDVYAVMCVCRLRALVLKNIQENHLSLSLLNIDYCRFVGLYAIWYRHRCLYVGQSDRQTVYDRLYRHLSDCHNENLRLWIRVKNGDLRFTSSKVGDDNVSAINGIETYLIRVLNPETNIQKQPGENHG